jgi:hypothetical protein
MSAASNSLENHVLNGTLRGYATPYSAPTAVNIKLALFSGTASDVLVALESGTSATTVGNWGRYEINTGAYARTQITFGSDATTGSIANTANCTFPTATANYNNTNGDGATVTCIAIIDEGRTQVMYYGLLTNSKEILNGDTFQVATGNLTISLA